jgi:hypothetical protein
LPGLNGRERRQFFDEASGGLPWRFSPGGALAGFAWAGVVGAVIGLAVGIGLGGWPAERRRFYRR